MNKKGQEKTLGKVLIVVAVVLVLLGAVFMIMKLLGSFKEDAFSGDFDGDNKERSYGVDTFDPCPCGDINDKQETTAGLFCVASYTPTQCGCANELANKAMQRDKGTKDNKALFFSLPDGKCLYDREEACKYLILGNSRFNTELLTSSTCPGLATK